MTLHVYYMMQALPGSLSKLGEGQLIPCSVFPPIANFKARLKKKNTVSILFCCPPDSSKKLRDWFEEQGINCPSPYDTHCLRLGTNQ